MFSFVPFPFPKHRAFNTFILKENFSGDQKKSWKNKIALTFMSKVLKRSLIQSKPCPLSTGIKDEGPQWLSVLRKSQIAQDQEIMISNLAAFQFFFLVQWTWQQTFGPKTKLMQSWKLVPHLYRDFNIANSSLGLYDHISVSKIYC